MEDKYIIRVHSNTQGQERGYIRSYSSIGGFDTTHKEEEAKIFNYTEAIYICNMSPNTNGDVYIKRQLKNESEPIDESLVILSDKPICVSFTETIDNTCITIPIVNILYLRNDGWVTVNAISPTYKSSFTNPSDGASQKSYKVDSKTFSNIQKVFNLHYNIVEC